MLTGATSELIQCGQRQHWKMITVESWQPGSKEDGMDTVFRFSNFLVSPFWALMILLPRWRWTERIIRSPLVSVAPAALYATLSFARLGEIWPAVARPKLK